MRSLKLDVKVWTEPMVAIFLTLGNDFANTVWEARLVKPVMIVQKDSIGEIWDEASDDGREVYHAQKPVSQTSLSSLGEWTRGEGVVAEKPVPSCQLTEKEQFIRDKYIFRKYTESSPTGAQRVLWNAVQQSDIRSVGVWDLWAFLQMIVVTTSDINPHPEQL